MRFKKAIKKIVALGAGASMVGASLMGALAVDLGDYPTNFIEDGTFKGILVVGDSAAAKDVIGITDIAISLQAAAVKPVESDTSVKLDFDGESYVIGGSGSKLLEMSEYLEGSNVNREAIANITSLSYLGSDELPGILASHDLSNRKSDAAYDQRLYFEDTTSGYALFTEDDEDDTVSDYLYFKSGQQIARYEMEFTDDFESDVDDSSGSASETGLFLTDYEDVVMSILGKDYTIVTARRTSTSGSNVHLTLMSGSTRSSLQEGQTRTFDISGKEYEVTLNFVDADEAQFVVNGELTSKLNDGDTEKLFSGTVDEITLGITDILYQDYAGGIHSASFFIGAQKLELRDSDITNEQADGGNSLEVDDENIDDAVVYIEGSDDNSTFRIERISVNMTANDDYYVPAGSKLSEVITATEGSSAEPEVVFTNNWDIVYEGLKDVSVNEIRLVGAGTDDYEMEFIDARGHKARFPLAHTPSASTLKLGDSDNNLVIKENQTIVEDDYFLLSDETDSNGERGSFVLRYKGSDKVTDQDPKIRFDDLAANEERSWPISPKSSQSSGVFDGTITGITEIAQIKIGGSTFRVYNQSTMTASDFNIFVDMDSDNSVTGQAVSLNTQYGAEITITNATANGVTLAIDTPDTDDYDDLNPNPFSYNVSSTSDTELRAATDSNDIYQYQDKCDGDEDKECTYSSYGAYIEYYNPSGEPQEFTIHYPKEQRIPQVAIIGMGTTSSKTTVTEGEAGVVQRIDVGATKLASEVTDIMSVNSILVGGPCANTAARTVMGNPEDCTAGFTPGVGMIKLFELEGENVAILVAGYTEDDTRNAATVLANYGDHTEELVGAEVTVEEIREGTLTVAPPSEEEETTDDDSSEDDTMDDTTEGDDTTDDTTEGDSTTDDDDMSDDDTTTGDDTSDDDTTPQE